MNFEPEHHHNRSIRIQGYDYSQAGVYFVTMVVQNRKCVLGTVKGGCILLTESGRRIEQEWLRLPQGFKSLEFIDFVIMPNHLHGIFMLLGTGGYGEASICFNRPRAPTAERFGAPVAGRNSIILTTPRTT